jgi:hypothetical protein
MTADISTNMTFGGNNDEGAYEKAARHHDSRVRYRRRGGADGVVRRSRSAAPSLWNTLSGRHACARLAAVCPMNHPAVKRVAILSNPGGPDTSPVVSGLSTANVTVAYLQDDGSVAASYSQTKYVRVSITGYELTLFIPFVTPTITAPPFSTTLPSESLGYVPDTGTFECFGT